MNQLHNYILSFLIPVALDTTHIILVTPPSEYNHS